MKAHLHRRQSDGKTTPHLRFHHGTSSVYVSLSHSSFFCFDLFVLYCFFFSFEKAAREHQSFELSTIDHDHHNANLKPNSNDSNIYGMNIQAPEEVQWYVKNLQQHHGASNHASLSTWTHRYRKGRSKDHHESRLQLSAIWLQNARALKLCVCAVRPY